MHKKSDRKKRKSDKRNKNDEDSDNDDENENDNDSDSNSSNHLSVDSGGEVKNDKLKTSDIRKLLRLSKPICS